MEMRRPCADNSRENEDARRRAKPWIVTVVQEAEPYRRGRLYVNRGDEEGDTELKLCGTEAEGGLDLGISQYDVAVGRGRTYVLCDRKIANMSMSIASDRRAEGIP